MTGGAPRRILVVDDDDAIRDVTALSLEAVSGFDVVTASGGVEALAEARARRPDAVLLDVMMPGMDGPTTLQHMRDDPELRTVPVVLLTAKVRATGERPGDGWADLDVAGVIPKPFDPMNLGTQVSRLLGW